MSELIYNGEHALLFQKFEEDPMNGPWENTWDKWHIAPSSRPYVVPAEPKTEYVDVPGADGSLDFTDILTDVKYSDRVGSWSFLVDHTKWNWPELYSQFMNEYQGVDIRVRLVDDPEYYYEGRISLKDYKQGSNFSSFEIDYHLGPFKWPINSTMNRYWKWNDLFGKPVFFGPFIADTVNLSIDSEKDSTILKEVYTKITKLKASDNPKANGWYKLSNYTYDLIPAYLITGKENPSKRKWYDEFWKTDPPSGINPKSHELYERLESGYVITSDTVVWAKQYYIKKFDYTAVEEPSGNPKSQGWCEKDSGYYFLTTDTSVDETKTYYIRGDQQYKKSTDTKVDSAKPYYEKNGVYILATEEKKEKGVTYYKKSLIEVPDTKAAGKNLNEFVVRSLYNNSKTTANVSLSTTGLFDYELYKYERTADPVTGAPLNIRVLEDSGRLDIGEYEDIFEILPGEVKLLKITSGVSFVQIEMADNKTL